MKYMGSKRRIAKEIIPIMLRQRKSLEQYWVEPFVGGGNVIEHISGNRIGADANKYTIEALVSIRDFVHELPKNNKEFTEEDYNNVRNGLVEHKHKGFILFAYAFGAKFGGVYARNPFRDYVKGSYISAKKQSKKLKLCKFIHSDYQDLEIPPNSIIYCDPPYEDTATYVTEPMDYTKFWDWCESKENEGHTLFISSYRAPKHFISVYENKLICPLKSSGSYDTREEHLFVLKDSKTHNFTKHNILTFC